MKDLAIYGGGGLGREVACLINEINKYIPFEDDQWNFMGFFDDSQKCGSSNKYGKYLGGLETLNRLDKPIAIVMAIGSPETLKNLTSRINNPLVQFPNIVAPNTLFFDSESTTMGKGNIVTFGCRLSCNTEIGDFNILNGNVSLGHDVSIGNYNVLMPEARLSGNVKAGNCNLFGARSFIIQGAKIGNDTNVGAGAIVFHDTKDGYLYLGNPAKKISI